jgi:ATP-dependent Clp protease ATP-binding subunit ClpA
MQVTSDFEPVNRGLVKPSLNLILALAVAVQIAFAMPSANAKPKPEPQENAWSKHGLQISFNFRFGNGDLVILKQGQIFTPNASIQVRRHGEAKAGPKSVEPINNIRQFGGPAYIFRGASDWFNGNYSPVLLASTAVQLSVLYVKGDNGIMVVGQINNLHPVRYFTHFIPESDAREIPIAQLSYILPLENGQSLDSAESAEVGILMGYANGNTITRTIHVPLAETAAPAKAVKRDALPADRRYLNIPFVGGAFDVPADLRQQVATSTTFASNKKLEGMDRYRESAERGKSLLTAMKAKIYGQDTAIAQIIFQYNKSVSLKSKKPVVIAAMGPSGVGKTYLAQEIGKEIFGESDRVLEIAGNEFNAHAESLQSDKLFGSPKGTRDAMEGSLITWAKKLEKLDEKGGLLIINEGDKMHPDVWAKFMELLDQGKITAGDGKVIKIEKLMVVITSNRGATQMFPPSVAGWSQEEIDKRLQSFDKNTLKGYYLAKYGLKDEKMLPREIINRINEFIPFGPLSREAAVFVAKVAANEIIQEYRAEYSVTLKFEEKAIEQIALSGWTAADDARQQVSSEAQRALDVAAHKLNVQNKETITVSYDVSDIRKPAYRVTVGERSATIDGKQVISNNPLKNENLKKTLLTLHEKMNSQVVGQDLTLKNVVEAVKSHAMRPEKNRPLVIGLLGVSGNGKTETARALADARYNGHIEIISMGAISNAHDFDKTFGSSAQFQGGDIAREFETALKNHPDGGVIVLDEISNMGGKNPALRAELLMKLYGIFEEGIFISPIDGKKYYLDKYVFIMTGNESEELFSNLTSDDMLKSTWEENRSPEKVHTQLADAKYPIAFINRAKWFLMKPLLSYEVHTVTQKLWHREADAFMRENAGLKITTGANFFDRVSLAYFSPAKGGRAVRDVFEDKIGNLILDALNGTEFDTADLRDVEMRFDLIDNRLTKPYIRRGSPFREVAFQATIFKHGQQIHSLAIDATDLAAEQMLLTKESALAVSYHEMGHAAFDGLTPELMKELGFTTGASISAISGMQLEYVTIRGGRAGNLKYYGYARSSPIKGAMLNPDAEKTIILMAQLWAGSKAQELAGFPKDAGWSNDLEKARRIATEYLTTWGLDRDLVGIPIDQNGRAIVPPMRQELFDLRMNQLMNIAEALSEKVVRARWDFIGTAAIELMKKGEVSIGRLREIDGTVAAKKAAGKRIRTYRQNPTPPALPTHHGPMTCEAVFG